MSFVRPEARATLTKWREALIGLPVAVLGVYWSASYGLLQWIGFAMLAIGAMMVVTGIQRALFKSGRGGPGLVEVDEGEVSYYGPLSGGSVSIRDLTLLSLDPRSKPAVWVLRQPGQDDLYVPVNAEGADALFDAFAALPGINTAKLVSTLQRAPAHPVVIWQKEAARLH